MMTARLSMVLLAGGLLLGCTRVEPPAATADRGGADTRNPERSTTVQVNLIGEDGKVTDVQEVQPVVRSDAEWQKALAGESCMVLRQKGTERPGTGSLLHNKDEGVYICAGCGLPLFGSESKFNSGTGWPSFFQPITPANMVEAKDTSHGMVRTEVLCPRCGGHLGHVFPDGPKPTGLRYCINSASLKFVPKEKLAQAAAAVAEGRVPEVAR